MLNLNSEFAHYNEGHRVFVLQVGEIFPHPEADRLEITRVDGRPCIFQKGAWKTGDLAVYVPIESWVPIADPRFAFMAKHGEVVDGRVRLYALKLRGRLSMGLLVASDPSWVEGQEVSAELGVIAFQRPLTSDPWAVQDPGFLPSYSIKAFAKWADTVLAEGEEVVVLEKVNGETGRFAFHQGQFWRASSENFKSDEAHPENPWPVVELRYGLRDKLRKIPGIALYGEVYGNFKGMSYGGSKADPRLVIFDAVRVQDRSFLNWDDLTLLCYRLELPVVPLLWRGPYSKQSVLPYADGKSVLASLDSVSHVREGFVLRTATERTDPKIGRVILKHHGDSYLLGKYG